ncbi:MAG TPA: hypothetical protein VHN39_15935 [Phenylobacterium sp.]|jgi:hypothetical protein|nr:hypothetical protein [Phenylobacterium sp.]
MKRLVLAGAAALALGSAATAAETTQTDRSCFWTRNIHNHTTDGKHTLYFNVGDRSVYRVQTADSCLAAASSTDPVTIQTHGAGGQVCEALDLNLEVRGARCIVESLTKLTRQETDALPKDLQPLGRLSMQPMQPAGTVLTDVRASRSGQAGVVMGIGKRGGP